MFGVAAFYWENPKQWATSFAITQKVFWDKEAVRIRKNKAEEEVVLRTDFPRTYSFLKCKWGHPQVHLHKNAKEGKKRK